MYTDVRQILRKRGRGYQIIAKDLEGFLTTNDYMSHYFDSETLTRCCGGDAYNWKLKEGVVYITFQFGGSGAEPVKIDLSVFRKVIKLLGDSKKLRDRFKNITSE